MSDMMEVNETVAESKLPNDWINETAAVRWANKVKFTGSVPIPSSQILETKRGEFPTRFTSGLIFIADVSVETFF